MIVSLFGYNANAQDTMFGLRGGLNVTSIAVDPQESTPDADSRIGFHLGGVALIGLNESIAVQPEITLSTQGAKFETANDIERVKTTYLNLAANIRYALSEEFYLLGGPQFGLLAGGDYEEEDKVDGTTESIDAKNFHKGTDIGIGFGAGYRLPSGLEISARYVLGITDNNDDLIEEAFFDLNQSIKNRGFQISVLYFFD